MIPVPVLADILRAAAAALAGYLLGYLYFSALRGTVDAFVARKCWWCLLTTSLLRVLGAAALLASAARFGAVALLTALIGFLIARARALRARGDAPAGGH